MIFVSGELCVFLSLLFHLLEVFLGCVNPCVGQKVTFSTKSDVVVFEGERVTLLCSVSDIPTDETPSFNITYENGTEIPFGIIREINIFTAQSVQIEIRTTEKFFCTVALVGFDAVANLSIVPFPNQLTHCASNYTNGIIVGQSLTLACASIVTVTFFLTWSSSDGEPVSSNVMTTRIMTLVNTINIQPSKSQNGSIFTCERSMVQSEQDRCSVGPIYVYEELRVFIKPVSTTKLRTIYPGESRRYICSSLPSSSIQWLRPDGLEGSGVELSVLGAMINVTVLSHSMFTGQFELICSGQSQDKVAREVLTLEVMFAVTASVTASTNAPAPDISANIALIVSLIVIGVIILCVLLIIPIVLYLRRRDSPSEETSISPPTANTSANDGYYEIDTAGDMSANTNDIGNSGNKPVAEGKYSKTIVNENSSIGYENAAVIESKKLYMD